MQAMIQEADERKSRDVISFHCPRHLRQVVIFYDVGIAAHEAAIVFLLGRRRPQRQ